jgi:hypothetical protein
MGRHAQKHREIDAQPGNGGRPLRFFIAARYFEKPGDGQGQKASLRATAPSATALPASAGGGPPVAKWPLADPIALAQQM